MAVRTENHTAATCKSLAYILVNDCLVRRNIDSAIFLGRGKTEDMVILIDGTTYSTK